MQNLLWGQIRATFFPSVSLRPVLVSLNMRSILTLSFIGHCFCQNCIHDLFAANGRRVKCPLCRKSWLQTDASKLVFYPVIVDLADSSVDYVIDGLNRMDKTCKSVSVKRAYTKLAKAAERIEEDNAVRLFSLTFSNKPIKAPLSSGAITKGSRELRPAYHPIVWRIGTREEKNTGIGGKPAYKISGSHHKITQSRRLGEGGLPPSKVQSRAREQS